MRFHLALLALAGASLMTSSVLADPVTYKGTLGKGEIVVEFTDDLVSGEPIAARYLYLSQGADIPLQAKSHKGSAIELSEEEACKDKCEEGKPGPIGAIWKLKTSKDGKTIEGNWVGKKTLPIKLTVVASRTADGEPPKTPLDLYNFTDMTVRPGDTAVTMENSPYDYLRLDVPLQEGEVKGWSDSAYRDVVDPRTKFARPRVVDLSGGRVSPDAANAVLQQRHWRDSIAALSCKALQYAGFQEYGPVPGAENGTLGDYDATTSVVTALTPKLMSWRESGSVWCGGAHPSNYSDAFTMDVASGKLLGLADIFRDVVDNAPGPTLVEFVKTTREKPSDQTDIDFEAECGTDELIGQYLAGSIKRDGDELKLVFGLQGLPHVIQACGDDVLELPVAQAMQLFTPEFAALLTK
jgi:hypothetical protein